MQHDDALHYKPPKCHTTKLFLILVGVFATNKESEGI
jgi:hypothetical protein